MNAVLQQKGALGHIQLILEAAEEGFWPKRAFQRLKDQSAMLATLVVATNKMPTIVQLCK